MISGRFSNNIYLNITTGMAKTRLHFMPGPTFLHRCVSERHILDIVSVYHNCECCCHYHLFWAFWNKLLSLNFSFIDVLRNMFVVQAQACIFIYWNCHFKIKNHKQMFRLCFVWCHPKHSVVLVALRPSSVKQTVYTLLQCWYVTKFIIQWYALKSNVLE